MELQHVVAAQISNHRNRLNLSQAELATRAAISQALLERLEEGRADASLADIGGLAKALGVEPKELLAPPPGPQSVYPYERFRFADDALARRCGLAEELVGAATGTMDLVAIIQLSKILTEHVQMRTGSQGRGERAGAAGQGRGLL